MALPGTVAVNGEILSSHVNDIVNYVTSGTPSVRVTNAGAIATVNNVAKTLTFDTDRWDTEAMHSTVSNTSRLTCVTAGKYAISGTARWEGNVTGSRQLSILLNATDTLAMQYIIAGAEGLVIQTLSTIYDLAVGDYVELIAYQNSGGALNITKNANYSPEFAMTRIG